MTITESIKHCLDAIKEGRLRSFIPLLSIFTLKGKPLTLDLHYQFAPLFNVVYPKQQTWMTGRQVGKTYQLAQSSAIRNAFLPYYDILHIQPRDDQRTRYHTTILKPLIQSCPISNMLIKPGELSKVLLKQFRSGSFLYLGTAYANPDALRGLSGCAQIIVDEQADIDIQFIPVIREVMAAHLRHGYSVYAGTPTTTDTTCGIIWDKSSQSEWITKCRHCGYMNIPNPEHDLVKMIGSHGPICAKCGKPVYPYDGSWVPAIPDRQLTFPGYHLSQTIHPLHMILDPVTGEPRKWFDLLQKVNSYSKLKLYNQVFGWPYDESINPLTLKDLVTATHDIKCNSVLEVESLRPDYRCFVIGVDWDGGGAQSQSYTAACVAGLRHDSDRIDILYGKRWPKGSSAVEQAQQLMQWIDILRPQVFAHDNTGAGFLRMEIMKQRGLLYTSTAPAPYTYTGPKKGDIVSLDKAQQQSDFYNYTLDKSRSLAILIQAIKDTSVRIPKFNVQDKTELAYDFLALKEDPRQSLGNKVVVLIGRKPGMPDDFAHAVNFAVTSIYYKYHMFPVLGQKYDSSALAQEYTNFSPRSQFTQFTEAIANRPILIQNNQEDPWNL